MSTQGEGKQNLGELPRLKIRNYKLLYFGTKGGEVMIKKNCN